MEEHLPIGFVADTRNLNVALTRCKIARYCVGAFLLFAQAIWDGHRTTKNKNHLGFFDFVNDLHQGAHLVVYGDPARWFRDGTKPETSDGFTKKMASAAQFNKTPATMPHSANQGNSQA
jgi:hypothetical protein